MKYLKITYVRKDKETNAEKYVVNFLNVNNIGEIGVDDHTLSLGINGKSCCLYVDRNKYPVFRLQTNSAVIYRLLKQEGFKVKRSYFW